MKHDAHRLLALAMALAMLLSAFALADDGRLEIEMDGDFVIETEVSGGDDAQGREGEVEIELDAGEDAPDAAMDFEAGAEIDLNPDLDGVGLESNEAAPAPETGAAAGTVADDEIDWTEWLSDHSLPTDPGDYRLIGDVIIDSSWIPAQGTTRLDLNGYTITLSAYYDTYAIQINSGATLEVYNTSFYDGIIRTENLDISKAVVNVEGSFILHYGKIRDCRTGVQIAQTGTFTMHSGVIIDCGTGVLNAGGRFDMEDGTIYLNTVRGVANSGTFNMTGGSISNHESSDNGAGVLNEGTFNMNGGEISCNTSNGNGAGVLNAGTFNLTGGDISRNASLKDASFTDGGGGVYNNGDFTMSGGTIAYNTSNNNGAGVRNAGTFNMTGGEISHNESRKDDYYSGGGGGVYNDNVFNMSGDARIFENKGMYGGGVSSRHLFNMTGGEIYHNEATAADGYGGGVYIIERSEATICGTAVIRNNTANKGGGVFNWGHCTLENGAITVNAAHNDGGGVCNYGQFEMSGGMITGNEADNCGGGVCNGYDGYDACSFIMRGGTISWNKAGSHGGGVYSIDKFLMENGAIEGNAASNNGGGVYSTDIFRMKNGSIQGNAAANDGGGVCNVGRFYMTGGAITGNGVMGDLKTQRGGGICAQNGTFTLSGKVDISGNKGINGDSDIMLCDVDSDTRTGIIIGNPLENKKPIGIAYDGDFPMAIVFTKGFSRKMGGKDPADYFVSQQEGCAALLNTDGKEAILSRMVTVTFYNNIITEKQEEKLQVMRLGVETELEPNTFVWSGHRFTHWSTYSPDTDTIGRDYEDRAKVTLYKDLDLYAKWKEIEPEPTLEAVPRADYTLLARMTASGNGKTALKVAWTKVGDAEGYDVYFAPCGKAFRLGASVSASDTCHVRFTGLKKRKPYKAYVQAWKKVNGKKVPIGSKSPELHAITGGYDKDYCNTKAVRLNRSALSLKVGQSKALRATLKGVKSGKAPLKHVRKVRWYSSDVNVATVDGNGRVKAVGQGACTVYALANNGVRSSVRVTVK